MEDIRPSLPENTPPYCNGNREKSRKLLNLFGCHLGDPYCSQTAVPGASPQLASIFSSYGLLKSAAGSPTPVFTQPDFLLLYCLCETSVFKILVGIASLRHVIRHVDQHTRTELCLPQYALRPGAVSQEKTPFSLLSADHDPFLTCTPDLAYPLTSPARHALLKLDPLLKNSMQWLNLKRGDLLIIDNRRSTHTCVPFTPFFRQDSPYLTHMFVNKPDPARH
ncbi:hypothetical protein [Dickeya fangzhongdai]|uniref:TauD/TfdA-like domain-containing protein n=1 Tax=Dickeya fangzhongdai TaxID=1778540 RepID=A0A2K8QMN1_9GAMM|nr:hypothetical protein [Dickeya fangzhongdai]ATZ94761.1 hypothetical protein CVE23_12695 [Dickeya fangzhongdai]QOH48202.1 hypothetical protein DYD82_12760 [Dickeya fangzhongdai]QOH52504.1 hypothetical protein DYD83_12760 [Dickeya fangzhongdai]WOY00292.1 hypothetical protein OGM22_00140 [Dickeya fangzhongdai]WOY04559.1 hypothetical protein OGM21_00090 [Dickeya fangzhongdai]